MGASTFPMITLVDQKESIQRFPAGEDCWAGRLGQWEIDGDGDYSGGVSQAIPIDLAGTFVHQPGEITDPVFWERHPNQDFF